MSGFDTDPIDDGREAPRQLAKTLRRCLGVLVEKAFTTPEYYPLTLKAATTGSNQKSNRSPVTNYTEDAVYDAMDELRELGLIAVVHPESGRTERFRHYLRKRYPFTEPQMAIMAELWLRGKQTLGELRSRASRMVPIESLEDLRAELQDLLDQGFVQATGDLARRGIEVDHNFYLDSEGQKLEAAPAAETSQPPTPQPAVTRSSESPAPPAAAPNLPATVPGLAELKADNAALKLEVEQLRQELELVKDDLDQLKQSLGV